MTFETPLGPCTLVWTPRGVSELHLPEPGERLRRAAPRADPEPPTRDEMDGEPDAGPTPRVGLRSAPAWVRRLAERVRGHLEGDFDDFLDVRLDYPEKSTDFDIAVWEAAREVPPGVTITYGELAAEAGRPGAARAVGGAMRRTPVALLVPAHRVIGAGRRPGGWTGAGGVTTKLRLLALEGVDLTSGRALTRRSGGA